MSKTNKQCIYKDDKRNTYSFKVYYIDFYGKRKQAFRRGFLTIKDAEKAMIDFLANHSNDCTMPFDAVVEQYLKYCTFEKELRTTTLKTKKSIINNHILPYFNNKPINKINQRDILEWHHKLKNDDSNYNDTYLYDISNLLIYIFSFAVNFLNLTDNVAEKCGSIGHSRNKHNDIFTEDEFYLFLDILNDEKFNKLNGIYRKIDNYTLTIGFKVLFYTGLRIGELLGLTVDNLNTETKELTIAYQYQNNEFCDPKTKASCRTIPICDKLFNDLRNFCDKFNIKSPTQRIFASLNRYNLRRALKTTIKLSNLHDMRLHDFRHSFSAYLHHIGATPQEAQDMLGHAKLSTTTDYYGHVYHTDLQALICKMNKYQNKYNKSN